MSDQKIKFDGMFKMSGRDFEKFWFSAGKTADPQNPGSKSEKSLRYTVSYQLYYLWSAFGVTFENVPFFGYDVENWVWTKLALWICPIL